MRLISMLCMVLLFLSGLAAAVNAKQPGFVGSGACANCHKDQYADWRMSQHRLAMQQPSDDTVLGRFDGVSFKKDNAKTVFFKRDGAFFVHTEGAGGQSGDFPVRYTFGLYPLQQYLIELPGGRLQAFGVAWDSRQAELGGQRWFDLYPDRKISSGDPLHWSGIDQNWNYQCAWCHATNLRKGYDAGSNTFSTTFTEIGVGCESCHGPASNHLDWTATRSDGDPSHGLVLDLGMRAGVSWKIEHAATAARYGPPANDKEALVCGGCHARRQQFSDDPLAVGHFYDAFRPVTLEPRLYFPDGQQREEVYNFASFLQSRMHAEGVTCSDCHNPHSGKPRLAGNALCGQCHSPTIFEANAHHHHQKDSAGAQCVNCHMPTTIYMGVDARHDHSMRIPRPDRTVSIGAPNSCGACHSERGAAWAEETLKAWFTVRQPGSQSFAEAFDLADHQAPGASLALSRVAQDESQSAMARASALQRLSHSARPAEIELAKSALHDRSPIIRSSAISVLANADPVTRIRTLPPLLSDETRLVRMDAARALAGEAEAMLPDNDRLAFEKALAEYEAGLAFNAERPESQANFGSLYLARGKYEAARTAYEKALIIDKSFMPAAIALADMARVRGDEKASEETLRRSIAENPASGPLAHALGLSLIRQKRLADAIQQLERAVELSPEDPRFAYVYGVALHDSGAREKAQRILEQALSRHPFDRELLTALASYDIEGGDYAAAARYAGLLAQLEPDDSSLRDFADWTRAMAERPRQ